MWDVAQVVFPLSGVCVSRNTGNPVLIWYKAALCSSFENCKKCKISGCFEVMRENSVCMVLRRKWISWEKIGIYSKFTYQAETYFI